MPAAEKKRPDIGYIIVLILLISVGLIMVYSTAAVPEPGSPDPSTGTYTAVASGWAALKHMCLWVGIGIPTAVIASRIPMRVWRVLSIPFLAVMVVLLASLLFPEVNQFAVTENNATRWIRVGGFQFQPSEFAKLAFILFSARVLERRKMKPGQWLVYLAVLASMALMIYKEPDLGTALVLVGTAFAMLITAGVNLKPLLLGAVVLGVVVLSLAWDTEHQQKRLLAWRDPWAAEYRLDEGYQVVEAQIAIARGGWFGVGLGQSTQKINDRLPEAETDFVFAILAEELGLLRALMVVALFAVLVWRGYEIAARAPDRYSSLVASGIISWIAVQSVLNLAVVTGTLPNTGVPLPFISKGGSSLLALMMASGIIIGISRRRKMFPSKVKASGQR